eukprot:8088010-Lingulodinium_polyedra.AAC.1
MASLTLGSMVLALLGPRGRGASRPSREACTTQGLDSTMQAHQRRSCLRRDWEAIEEDCDRNRSS